ncbi:putative V-type H+-transporting ATPase subunit e [Blattamonas nauphoetae]|uniref:V-type H+-transporting ATPase subunit e n=1 Tax=Blattamonas nauphoetae TaxID=2049346 RepID=A0ABQ9YEK5_9EUKA|nr:putative V-type H+-transporting ATPase subunit e [Blattamonas nauphoetae]
MWDDPSNMGDGLTLGIGTLVFVALALIAIPGVKFTKQKQIYLVYSLGSIFCMWLMWFIVFIAQMNPLIEPQLKKAE